MTQKLLDIRCIKNIQVLYFSVLFLVFIVRESGRIIGKLDD